MQSVFLSRYNDPLVSIDQPYWEHASILYRAITPHTVVRLNPECLVAFLSIYLKLNMDICPIILLKLFST